MNFLKKLKIRLYLAIGYVVLGIGMILAFNIIGAENEFLSFWGLALVVIGITRMRNYFLITKNEETIKKQEIAESDERNITISEKAKSISFIVYIIATGLAVIVLQLMNNTALAATLSYTVCFLILIYWISYLIIRRKY